MATEESAAFERLTVLCLKLGPAVTLLMSKKFKFPEAVAEDALQNVFVKLAVRLRRGQGLEVLEAGDEADFLRYLARAVFHECLSHARFLSAQHRKEAALLDLIQPEPAALDSVIDAESVSRLHSAISELGPPYGEIFSLLIEEGLSLAEIARRLDISAGSIYTQFQRGIARLREILARGEP